MNIQMVHLALKDAAYAHVKYFMCGTLKRGAFGTTASSYSSKLYLVRR